MATKKQTEQPVAEERVYEEAPGEYPVMGYEPLEVPQGFTIADLMARVEALEAAVKPSAPSKK